MTHIAESCDCSEDGKFKSTSAMCLLFPTLKIYSCGQFQQTKHHVSAWQWQPSLSKKMFGEYKWEEKYLMLIKSAVGLAEGYVLEPEKHPEFSHF